MADTQHTQTRPEFTVQKNSKHPKTARPDPDRENFCHVFLAKFVASLRH
ncbi:hypothetical protein [Xenorhabdus japonica]|nr:hypothetical protein [Xenorhabdus japonica]